MILFSFANSLKNVSHTDRKKFGIFTQFSYIDLQEQLELTVKQSLGHETVSSIHQMKDILQYIQL